MLTDRILSGNFFSRIFNRAIIAIINFIWKILWFLFRVARKLILRPVDKSLAIAAKQYLHHRSSIDAQTIMLFAMRGDYSCNIKYIGEALLESDTKFNIIWVVQHNSRGPFPRQYKLIRDKTRDFYEAAFSAHVIVQNGHCLQRSGVKKVTGQIWIQTWHGSLGLKRLEGAGGNEAFYRKMQKLEQSQTDLLLTNSRFEEDVFERTYWNDVKVARVGHARNDILFDKTEATKIKLRRKIFNSLRLADHNENILLLAPSHHDGFGQKGMSPLDFYNLERALTEKFGGRWYLFVRSHTRTRRHTRKQISRLPDFCINASYYPDIQELMVIADVGITDYSSWICDYILTNKPAFLYCNNYAEYEQIRGFYHERDKLPFSLATDENELINNIQNYNQELYERKVSDFLKMCECIDDGGAADRAANIIEKFMKK